MNFVADHCIIYKGKFYKGNEPFKIDDADAKEMEMYGKVIADTPKKPIKVDEDDKVVVKKTRNTKKK